jgi:hypothetical protein
MLNSRGVMSTSSRRVLISCAIISIAIVLCICLIGLAGLGIFTLYPVTVSEQSVTTEPVEGGVDGPESQLGAPSPAPNDSDSGIPALTPTVEPAPESSLPAQVVTQMDEIQAQVADLRGLPPLETVDRYLLTPEQLRERVMNDFLEDYYREDARDDAIVLAALGLLDPQFDLYDLFVELYSEQIVGYYDSDTKEMYVIQGSGFSGPERLTYAHEYVHALQDQHYNIEEGLLFEQEYCESNTEYCAAVQSLLEGDASLLELQWLFTHATNQDIQEIQEFYTGYESPVFEAAPSFLSEDFLFPYFYGHAFVETIYDAGGWAAVDQVYANPPVSTEQILHPERYPNVTPVTVELPDYLPLLEGGWRELDRNILGEWYTYLLLSEALNEEARLDEERSREAADGWAGDFYAVYYLDETDQTVLILKTAWKNDSEARQFSEAFQDYANARFGVRASSAGNTWTWEDAQAYTQLNLDGAVTTWVLAPDAALAELMLNNLETR